MKGRWIWLASCLLLLCACNKTPETHPPTPYDLMIPAHFPTTLNQPDDNPLTVEGIALGRHLFYDTRIRGYVGTEPDSMMSCASCHVQAAGFDVGANNPRLHGGRPVGVSGVSTRHTAMPLCNLIFNNEGYFWNGSVYTRNPNTSMRNLEDIVRMAITAADELNAEPKRVCAVLSEDAEVREMFLKAFGTEEVTMNRICKAIAQFLRTLISSNTKFDRYLRGEAQLTDQELRGYVLFTTEEGADCFHCHGSGGTPLFTTNLFYNNALSSTFDDPFDRFSVTGMECDHGAYRAPSLRNIAVTAPYMHDGRFSTLDEVLQFYNQDLQNSPYVSPLMHKINDGGACLTPSQILDLKAFLYTLTDETFLTNPNYSNPNP